MAARIRISAGFCGLVCVLGWYDLRLCLWFLAALLCHEAGHGAALALCRVPVEEISLRLSGAVIRSGLCSYRQELLCAAAGPAAGIVLASLTARLVPELAVISLLLSTVNLLPLYPLDGGRMLRAFLLPHWEPERAARLLAWLRFVLSGLLMLAACWVTAAAQAGIWPIFLVLVLLCRSGEGQSGV